MIKYPGSEVAIWTLLFMIAGSFLAYLNFTDGKYGLAAIFAVLPIASALVWLGIRAAKWLIVAYFGFASLAGFIFLIANEFTWRRGFQVFTAGYVAYFFATWNGSPADAPQDTAEATPDFEGFGTRLELDREKTPDEDRASDHT